MRIAQEDILDFCVNSKYAHQLKWPEGYWPKSPAPPSAAAWDDSVASFKREREKFKELTVIRRTSWRRCPPARITTHTFAQYCW
jgi:hypothetical protein